MIKYQVAWDNGNHASGSFPDLYDTRQQADDAGKNWLSDMQAEDPGYDGYEYEVVEIDTDDVKAGLSWDRDVIAEILDKDAWAFDKVMNAYIKKNGQPEIKGYKLYDEYPGYWVWYANDKSNILSIYATPYWEGVDGIVIQVMDLNGYSYEDLNKDIKFDGSAEDYVNKMGNYINAFKMPKLRG
jgi:hypothetical protein